MLYSMPEFGALNTSSIYPADYPAEREAHQQNLILWLLKPASFGYSTLKNIAYNRTKLEDFIFEISKLEFDWDGYDGLPISEVIIKHALALIDLIKEFPGLPDPEILPRSNGVISFIWETANGKACIQIGNNNFSGYITCSFQGDILFQGQSKAIDKSLIAYIFYNLFQEKESTAITRISLQE